MSFVDALLGGNLGWLPADVVAAWFDETVK
jgi:hypothetical protein